MLEKLSVENMLRNHSLSKSISDASWSNFTAKAVYKADALGKWVLFIDPWGTTQFCHCCLNWVPKGLTERGHKCKCGAKLPRDVNSAKLIKRIGINRNPPLDGGSSLAELGPLPSLRGMISKGG